MKLTSTQKKVIRQVNGGVVYLFVDLYPKNWIQAIEACVKKGLITIGSDKRASFTEKGFEILDEAYRP